LRLHQTGQKSSQTASSRVTFMAIANRLVSWCGGSFGINRGATPTHMPVTWEFLDTILVVTIVGGGGDESAAVVVEAMSDPQFKLGTAVTSGKGPMCGRVSMDLRL
jgi:hypothetical protein